jgi:hypothetical protein
VGATNAHLLAAVEGAPPGADTLVFRMLHVFTTNDKGRARAVPVLTAGGIERCPPELAQAVTRLYSSRIQDARLLVPVLSGLPKVLLRHLSTTAVRLSSCIYPTSRPYVQRQVLELLPELISLKSFGTEVLNRLLGNGDPFFCAHFEAFYPSVDFLFQDNSPIILSANELFIALHSLDQQGGGVDIKVDSFIFNNSSMS